MSVSGRTTDYGDRVLRAETVKHKITKLLVARQLSQHRQSSAVNTDSVKLLSISFQLRENYGGGRCSLRDYNSMKADHNDNINQNKTYHKLMSSLIGSLLG